MRKITLSLAIILAMSSVFSQILQRKWYGSQTDQLWDVSTANWLDPNFALPLPKTFESGATAIFDDSSVAGSDTIQVSGQINIDSLLVKGTKGYVIRYKASTDSLIGKGYLIKSGSGTFVMDIRNAMAGGTILKEGRLMMEKQTTKNIFGTKLRFEGGIANFATTTSSAYPLVTVPVEIPAGVTAKVELSRYSYWSSPITGSGDLTIYAGGDRVYIGQKNVAPDWSKFSGKVRVEKYEMSGVKPGFYGLILNTNRTFKDSLNGFNIDSTFNKVKLTLAPGVTIGAESGTRMYAVGEIASEDSTSLLGGYYKDSTTPKIGYTVGSLNTDVVYPGKIGYIGTKAYNLTGIVKVGTGTYTFTNSDNRITSGITVRQGRVLINDKNLNGNFNGGTGGIVTVKKNGIIGGTGRISGNVDVFGKLEPGSNGIGTLLIADSSAIKSKSSYGLPVGYSFKYTNASGTATTFSYKSGGTGTPNLNLHAGSVSEFEIKSVQSYDKVIGKGKLKFGVDTTALGKPKIKIVAAAGISVTDNDRFEIIKTSSLDAASAQFDIEYPNVKDITWTVETKYDTVAINKETLTFTDKVTTKWTTDSLVTTKVVMDSMIVSYKVTVIAHKATGVDNASKSDVRLFPNPAQNVLNIESSDAEIKSVDIINLQGQIVRSQSVYANKANIPVDDLSRGIYFAKVYIDGATRIQKVVLK
jgi:hypothetical protein